MSIKSIVSVLVAAFIAVAGFSGTANAADVSGWQKQVTQEIAKKQTYPRAALRKELEGKLTVEIKLDRDGNIVAHNIVSSSGHDVLDREVGKILKRVSLPTPPSAASDAQLTMSVPLAWALQ
ncbi:energy transducer TonB [Pseudemcibacter aquimaris]|uniref:energy transducer TonB n=1 Tax=Pseudemcibacter aquimaris TaxID=2857064 RepID=UPI002012C3D7|nr:TonB family protein [Pseudemcibacter aquimaris]MCC3861035.1 energy transducer TonB [Pseudemcibacter aquimaris]WDU59852.1 energy transducer TonB [Pseudemcibacter aquimaris]